VYIGHNKESRTEVGKEKEGGRSENKWRKKGRYWKKVKQQTLLSGCMPRYFASCLCVEQQCPFALSVRIWLRRENEVFLICFYLLQFPMFFPTCWSYWCLEVSYKVFLFLRMLQKLLYHGQRKIRCFFGDVCRSLV
jgi:hypothetical protein